MTDLGTVLLVAGLGALFVVPGWLAYAGRWRDWVNYPFVLYAPLAMLWMGVGGEIIVVGGIVADAGARPVGQLLGAIGMALLVVGGICLFWTPPSLRPRWLRERDEK